MRDLIVVMGASSLQGTMSEYLSQLSAAKIHTYVHPIDSNRPNLNSGGTLGGKINDFRMLASQFSCYENIIFSDAWDVTFFGTREDVIRKIPHSYVLQAAEKNQFPILSFGGWHGSPWRYVNGGLTAARTSVLLQWLDDLEKVEFYQEGMNDQAFFNELIATDSRLCRIDSKTDLFFCVSGGREELIFQDGLPFNTYWETWPNFIHCNGRSNL